MERDDILRRYRHLRGISSRHQSGALACVARPGLLERAKTIGLARGQRVVADSEAEMTLVFDLAVHAAKPGRSRAIDRYAKTVRLAAGSDEAVVLEAMRNAQFSVWRVDRHHDVTGLVVTDLLRKRTAWLVDEALTGCAMPGVTFAARLNWPAEFAMSSGVVVPVERALMEAMMLGCEAWIRTVDPVELADDPRFAAAVYRHAIKRGVMNRVQFRDTAAAA